MSFLRHFVLRVSRKRQLSVPNVEHHNFCSIHLRESFQFNALGEIVARNAVPERRSASRRADLMCSLKVAQL
jgi:hypothetical protein